MPGTVSTFAWSSSKSSRHHHCLSGSLLGIGCGFFLAWLIARTAEWKTIVTTASVVIAFGVSVFVGIVFGIYPAVKASRINPIDALRYE